MSICETIHQLLADEIFPPQTYEGFPGPYNGNDPYSLLWLSGPKDMASGARQSVQNGFGMGHDRGTLRRQPNGNWQYLEFGNQWIDFHPNDHNAYVAASAFNRYGVGWSFGPSSNMHGEHIGMIRELCGIDIAPDSMCALDFEHSNQLYNQLHSEWFAKFGTSVDPGNVDRRDPTNPPVNPPVTPIPPINQPTNPPVTNPPVVNPPTTISVPCKFNPNQSFTPSFPDPQWYKDAMGALKSIDAELSKIFNEDSHDVRMGEQERWTDALQEEIDYWSSRRPQVANRLKELVKRLTD